METLAISAANLNTIEKNLNAVANELSGVVNNVSSVNSQVSKVENQVASLNNEVKSLVEEIRETTIISNARQSIMYNNEQIDKKFSYYDTVRRTTESLLDAIMNSSISRETLYNLNQNLLINNPNYWLSNALAALSFWLQNDRINTEKEVNNALKKDEKKTSLFFTYIYIKLNRQNTAINWLKKYLSLINPLELNKDFITVLDLMNSGLLGQEGRMLVLSKISDWFQRLKNDTEVINRQQDIWETFIHENEDNDIYMPYLENNTKDINILKHNLATTSSYTHVLNHFNTIMNERKENKSIDEIINNLIYDYESKEQIYQLDNLRNNLIIACNGNREEANKLYKKQELLYQENIDLITVSSNIVIYDTEYKVSSDTKKLALSLVKDYIISAYININKTINKNSINININGFQTDVEENIDRNRIDNELTTYIEKEFFSEDKDITIILLILNILGIIGIFITLDKKILSYILIAIIIFGDVFLMIKMSNRNKLRQTSKNTLQNSINNTLESVLAEITDYHNLIKEDELEYNKLINYLNSLEAHNYTTNNNERNINIGG